MNIEILCTGDEILSGKTINTNYSYIARRLLEAGFSVSRGTIVGDDRVSLKLAFMEAASRADLVIVNGGLGPTVDDLSQEVAADAAGVELELNEAWLKRISSWYQSRGRVMPANNQKQAMLPQGAEFIDNPIGTACGFAIDIKSSRFFFTPGVPVEMKRMLDEQILPRFQTIRGETVITRVKRFHTFGIGESRADQLLDDIEIMALDCPVKLGFQSHYPQLETKLSARASSEEELVKILEPLEMEVRNRLGNFVLAEDDNTVEQGIIRQLEIMKCNLSTMEMHTGGGVIERLAGVTGSSSGIRRGIVFFDINDMFDYLGLNECESHELNETLVVRCAVRLREISNSSYALVVLVDFTESDAETNPGADVFLALASVETAIFRFAVLPGGENWVRKGATEMGLDFLRRYFQGISTHEKIDFEQH